MTAHSAPPAVTAAASAKRARILDAAERIFGRDGFFSAKVADVAREAGVADGTIYLYFKSKDDLLISLFESRMERVNAHLAAAIAPVVGARARLTTFVRAFLQLVHDQPQVAEVLTVELRQSSKFMKEYDNPHFAAFLRQLATIVADGQKSGELTATVPPPIAARMIFGMLDELATAWLLAADGDAARGASRAGAPSRGKKFDIVRAAAWAAHLITTGLVARSAGQDADHARR